MESAKKIIPFILVAIVFAVGGYFVGAGNLSSQSASIYRTTTTNPCDNSPMNPCPAKGVVKDEWGNCFKVTYDSKGLSTWTHVPCPFIKTSPSSPVPVSSTTVRPSTTTVKPSTTIKSQ